MKVSLKALLIITVSVFFNQIFTASDTEAQENKKYSLSINHHIGELRKVNTAKILTQSTAKVSNASKVLNKKIIIYETCFVESYVDVENDSSPKRIFLKIEKNRKKTSGTTSDTDSKMFVEPDEGESKVLTGKSLGRYRKSQADFGLYLPSIPITVGYTWEPSEEQMKDLFDGKILEDNSVKFKLTEIKSVSESIQHATIEREIAINFVLDNDKDSKSSGIEKSRTTYVLDLTNNRLVSVSDSQVLIIRLENDDKHQIIMKIATETGYRYSEDTYYKFQISPNENNTQTERTFVDFGLKMLIATKKDNKQYVAEKNKETDKIIHRKSLKVNNNKINEFTYFCEYDRTIESDKDVSLKKTQKINTSPLEGKKFKVKFDDDGKQRIYDHSNVDVTDIVHLPENNQNSVNLGYPEFSIPIGYSWLLENEDAIKILSGMFSDIEIKSISAKVVFVRVFKNIDNNDLAEFRVDFAITGKTREFGRLIFAVSIFNHVNLTKRRIERIFTERKNADKIVLRMRFENEEIIVDGIGTLRIQTQYFYNDNISERSDFVGKWILVDRKTKEQNSSYSIEICKSGLIVYKHPHIKGKETIVEIGVWRIEKDVLTIKLGIKKDIYRFKTENNVLNLTKILKTSNSTAIFPWRVNQTDNYVKSE